jgi:hypothetical protein
MSLKTAERTGWGGLALLFLGGIAKVAKIDY